MAWQPEDVSRSVRRYFASTLSDELAAPLAADVRWKIALSREQVRDDQRPAGLLELGTVEPRGGFRTSVPQGTVIEGAPITLSLFPELQEVKDAERRAHWIAAQCYDAVRFGLNLPPLPTGRPRCGPDRIPLYDYSGSMTHGTAAQRQGPTNPHDVLWVDSKSARAVQDPLDARRWSVILELAVSWERPGAVRAPGPVVVRVPGKFTLPP